LDRINEFQKLSQKFVADGRRCHISAITEIGALSQLSVLSRHRALDIFVGLWNGHFRKHSIWKYFIK
jgi:hypothetical protein